MSATVSRLLWITRFKGKGYRIAPKVDVDLLSPRVLSDLWLQTCRFRGVTNGGD
jgi:hypothetical protein